MFDGVVLWLICLSGSCISIAECLFVTHGLFTQLDGLFVCCILTDKWTWLSYDGWQRKGARCTVVESHILSSSRFNSRCSLHSSASSYLIMDSRDRTCHEPASPSYQTKTLHKVRQKIKCWWLLANNQSSIMTCLARSPNCDHAGNGCSFREMYAASEVGFSEGTGSELSGALAPLQVSRSNEKWREYDAWLKGMRKLEEGLDTVMKTVTVGGWTWTNMYCMAEAAALRENQISYQRLGNINHHNPISRMESCHSSFQQKAEMLRHCVSAFVCNLGFIFCLNSAVLKLLATWSCCHMDGWKKVKYLI